MATPPQLQSSTHPPAQPAYILRGHTAQIHAVHFFRRNLRLLTGDADGWVVVWSLPVKRLVAVWKAHGATVLGAGSWGGERVVTHGRDGKLHIWQLREEDESGMSKVLPVDDDGVAEGKQPWVLHTLVVNAINFCSFASLARGPPDGPEDELLVATPGVQDGSVNVTSFPNEDRVATVPPPKGTNTGMLMAVALYHATDKAGTESLNVITGYESGHAGVFRPNASGHWECVYIYQAHAQPILSLAFLPSSAVTAGIFFTSSADAVIARHPLPSPTHPRPNASDVKVLQTKHAGQQSLTLRSDNRIFATAGWDGRVRVYSVRAMKELAVLKWHKDGCYAVAFAEVRDGDGGDAMREIDEESSGDQVAERDLTVAEKRLQKTQETHWLAAGSKDGRVSLWEVY